MRSYSQWLLMIARTQKTEFALAALKTQLERERQHLSEAEFLALWQQLHNLKPEVSVAAGLGVVNVDYRPEGMGGRGRLYLEVGGRTLREPAENTALDELQVYLFWDGMAFAGLQMDNAKTLPERLPVLVAQLEVLPIELLDCPEAGLYGTDLGQILEWVVRCYF
jgi:hypothetical protein